VGLGAGGCLLFFAGDEGGEGGFVFSCLVASGEEAPLEVWKFGGELVFGELELAGDFCGGLWDDGAEEEGELGAAFTAVEED